MADAAFAGHLAVPANVLFQEIAGEAVLLETTKARYFTLDEVGTSVWKLLVANPELSAVKQQMLSLYDVDEAQLEQDLRALIDNFLSEGLLEVVA